MKESDLRIVPGQRIGSFILGASPDAVLPTERGSETGIAEHAMRMQVRVQLEAGRLVDVSTGNARFATDEGFRPGGDYAPVEAAWGPPPHRHDLEGGVMFDFKAAWPARGVDALVKDGKILHMGVFPAEHE